MIAQQMTAERIRKIYLCGYTTGVDCGSGHQEHNLFVTDDESLAQAHVEKYAGWWTTAGWYREIEFRQQGGAK